MAAYSKVLLVEDNAFIAELYADVLNQNGFSVTCAYDGGQGLSVAQNDPFDVILLDLMLPVTSGLEVLTTLRNPKLSPGFKQTTPIIILTNFEEDDMTKQKLMSMSQGYLIKVSITPGTLAQALKDMANGKPLPSSSKQKHDDTLPL